MQELQVKGERYYMEKKVGSGCSAEVFRAVSGRGEALCVKVISPHFYSSQLGQDLINNEISILERLDHANILKFYKKEAREKLMIVTEYCPDGTLFEYLGKRRTLPEEEALQMVRGVVRGCEYMLGRGILHRDLKPQNIFLKGKNIKIADFGFAVQTNNTKLMAVNVGSPLYMPYQSLQEKKFSAKSDIFAIGVIWYQLISGKTPFQAGSQKQLKEKMRAGAFRLKELPCNKKTQDLIFKCLSFKTQHRPTIQELRAAVEEMDAPQKEKSKTFYDGFTYKRAEKENMGNKTIVAKEPTRLKTASKEPTRLKTASTKITQSSNNPRPQRCKTFLSKQQSKDPFSDYIKATISRRPSQQSADPRKKEAASELEKEKTDQSFMDYLLRLQKVTLPFLPLSVQLKFTSLLSAYHHLLSRKKAPSMAEKDDMLAVLVTCTKESQFCKCCLSFVRRLMRLAKSYKECSGCLKELTSLWQRVERKSGGV